MQNRLTRGAAAFAGLVLTGTGLGLGVVSATPAAASSYDCPAGYFCGWSGESATGSMWKTSKSVADLGAWDNKIHSYVNRTKVFACVYEDKNYSPWGGYFAQDPNSAGEYSSGPDATTSSIKFVHTERECGQTAYPRWYSEIAPKAQGFGDMNGDRRADVIARDDAGRLWFTPGNGTGRLIGSGFNGMNTLTRHGDLSRDGREDLVTREAATGKLWLYPGTGTGSLGSRRLIGAGGWNGMSKITAFGDLTGDGRSDLLAVEKSTGKLWLYPGTTTGTLGSRRLIGSGGWNSMNALVGMGDVNGDGRADLYAREAATGKLWLYPGTTTGKFGTRKLVGSGGWNAMANLISVGDFSGDGRPDLATVTNEKYAIDGYVGNPGWLIKYLGRDTGTLAAGERTDGEWWGLNGLA
ncbi:FG-GAP-like repeat-containing protein [Streptomyces echinatus]|uniref:FG-GAP-like repeat-containing protein n=1 Tax=Streptomyces echinatus TaxID=67293 RepID=UPI0037A36F2B